MNDSLPDNTRSGDAAALGWERHGHLSATTDVRGATLDALRLRALQALDLQPGDTVFDVGCGDGRLLPALARQVQQEGWVLGIEESASLAQQARRRVEGIDFGYCVQVEQQPVERLQTHLRADALLFSFAHDVLQSPDALNRLIAHCRPGARIAIVGLRTLPWWWGWPINAVNLYRSRGCQTSFTELEHPWRLIEGCGAQLQFIDSGWCSNLFVMAGRLGVTKESPNPYLYAPAFFEPLFIPSAKKRESP